MERNSNLDQLQLDFISTVSHELRTPLTSIRGFAETLIASHDQLSLEQQMKFLNIIKDQSNRLISLVENLLSATAQASAEEIYVLKSVNAISVLEKTISIIKQKYPRKDIFINSIDFLPKILVDEDKFEQVLINIIENACKYSYENSNVNISLTCTNNEFVAIAISNEGETIEEKNKTKIFEKFSRLDNPMTRLTQGSGMGLYLASNMTKKMHGKIDVESKDSHTTFTIYFPIATAENIAQYKLKAVQND